MTTTYKDYVPETLSLVNRLIAGGFTILGGHDGEAWIEIRSPEQAAKALCAVDEAKLFVQTPSGAKCALFLVFGNEPGVLVADHSVNEELEAVTTAHGDEWEGKEQPMKAKSGDDEPEVTERETNEQFILRLLTFGCPTGALIQPFVLQAIGYYACACKKAGAQTFENPMMNGEAWIRTAEFAEREVAKHLNL